MLDYDASITSSHLASIVQCLLESMLLSQQLSLCVVYVTDADCSLLVDIQAVQSIQPMFITFDRNSDNGLLSCHWASSEQTQELHNKLKHTIDSMMHSYKESKKKVNDQCDSIAVITIDSSQKDGTITSTSLRRHSLAAPTIHGCLLGYPAVYAVNDIEGAHAASRWLSTSTLRLYSVRTDVSVPGTASIMSNGTDALLSFSLPVELESSSMEWKNRIKEWCDELKARHRRARCELGIAWSDMDIRQNICTLQGVAL